jgi:hypothetical protein
MADDWYGRIRSELRPVSVKMQGTGQRILVPPVENAPEIYDRYSQPMKYIDAYQTPEQKAQAQAWRPDTSAGEVIPVDMDSLRRAAGVIPDILSAVGNPLGEIAGARLAPTLPQDSGTANLLENWNAAMARKKQLEGM